ncbi:MAG: guanylate kinase [Rhodocyclaceae bacterium]|nr:guanylate kinase [Rhodocyclaceae bacterium]
MSTVSGNLLIVSAPSGAGKTTLVRALLERDPRVVYSVSCTTRAPRAGERDGVDYLFVSDTEFRRRIDAGEFLEHAEVHGHRYGTLRSWITAQLAADRDVVLDIDTQGAAQVRALMPEAVSIFILPPSLAELEARLRARGTDAEAVIERRLAAARAEIAHVSAYDYAIINKDLDAAIGDLVVVVQACRLRLARQLARHAGLLGEFR